MPNNEMIKKSQREKKQMNHATAETKINAQKKKETARQKVLYTKHQPAKK